MCVLAATPLTIHFFLKPHLRELARHFEVTLAYNPRSDAYLQPLGLPVHERPVPIERKIALWRDLRALLVLCRLFASERFDIVVSVVPKAGLLGMLAAWLLRVPRRVHIFQGEVWASRRGPMRWLLKSLDGLTARVATHVLAVSESERNFLVQQGVAPAGKVRVLGAGSICGVDTGRFRPDEVVRAQVRAELGVPESAVLCIFLGRLTEDKGVLELAHAFAQSATTHPALWLLLVGPDEEDMQVRLRALVPPEQASRMLIRPFANEPQRMLAAADFLCLPSYREGFGMAILEAAAAGIPAIGSRIYGITDAIEDGRTGLLVPARDTAALAAAISRWCEQPQERQNYGVAAQDRVRTRFEQKNVVKGYVEYFSSLFRR
jgi:glycosyltransferase involved in cell wall biosynthesis